MIDPKLKKKPPKPSSGILSDVRYFLLHKPEHKTLIKFKTQEDRENYNRRISQRIGLDPDKYLVLNVHKIGIKAPISYVFDELLRWNGDSTCWPNHIAKVDRIQNNLEDIQILPFGWTNYPFGWKRFLGINLISLFLLKSIRIKRTPDSFDFDNARYLLYECSGGYPIGIYAMYVRSSIADLGEPDSAQLFFIVGFNFYGKESWTSSNRIFNKIWVGVHNRVTANVLNRIKQLGEWRIEKIQSRKKKNWI